MHSFSFKATLEVLVHGLILVAPLFLGGVLHASDSLFRQIPTNYEDLNENITEVGFGIRHFSVLYNETTEEEDVRFSDEQQDELGRQHSAAHITFHALQGLMWMILILPMLVAIFNRWWKKMAPLLALSKFTASLSRLYVPLMIVLTLLMAVPFVLLSKSNLCGPMYMQLGFAEEEASLSSDEDDHDNGCHSNDLEGTYAIMHEDVPATCEMGPSSIGFIAATAIWPVIMMVQIYFLRLRSEKMERDYQLAIVLDRTNFAIDQGSVEGEKDLADDETSFSSSESLEVF
jgi:hypothetical protein